MKRLPCETYDRIDREVYSIHIDYNIRSFPVDEKWLAGEMRFKFIPYSALPEAKRKSMLDIVQTGIHYCDKSQGYPVYVIVYNDDTEPGRAKLTVFHEIAHIVLGHGSDPTEEEEAEADYFAKQLAAPRCLLRLREHLTATEIHDKYGLSWEAAGYSADSVMMAFLNYGKEVFENDREYVEWARRWLPS